MKQRDILFIHQFCIPVIHNPLCTAVDVEQVREFVPEDSVPYVGEALTILRKEVLGMFPLHFPLKTVFIHSV